MTWGSERSGMASSFTARTAATAASIATPTPTRTTRRARAQSSMILATIPSPLARVRRVPSEALDGGAEAALGVDQEGGGGDDPLAGAHALEDRDLLLVRPAGPHAPRLEAPAVLRDEHVLHLARVDERSARDHHRLRRAQLEGDLPVHAGPELQAAVA